MRFAFREIFELWFYVVSLVLMMLSTSVFGANSQVETIRVMTYNVQFLPGLASVKNKRMNPEYRAERISEEISKYDIVGLQETFHAKYRKKILNQVMLNWGGEFPSLRSPTPNGFMTSGGCLLLSRCPIANSDSVVFTNFSKPVDYGLRADGFAAKGVIHALVTSCIAPKEQLDVFVTHLESKADDMRLLQFAEMATFVKAVSEPSSPAIIIGDMNTRGAKQFRNDADSQYSALVKQLGKARPGCDLIDVWPYLKGDALGGTNEQESHEIGKRIDYIFVINPPLPKAQLKPVAVEVRPFQDPKVTALSDHNAVAAELEWHHP